MPPRGCECATYGDKDTGLILGLQPANERRRYFVTTSLIGWMQDEDSIMTTPGLQCMYMINSWNKSSIFWSDPLGAFFALLAICVGKKSSVQYDGLAFPFSLDPLKTLQMKRDHITILVQDCSNSSGLIMELLQFCCKPWTYDSNESYAKICLSHWQFYLPRPIRWWYIWSPEYHFHTGGFHSLWISVPLLALSVNPLRPSDPLMRRQTSSTLVQIMACRLFGAKPLSKPMLTYCQLEPWE